METELKLPEGCCSYGSSSPAGAVFATPKVPQTDLGSGTQGAPSVSLKMISLSLAV